MQYGLIGENLSHSFSVLIHSMLGDYAYELKNIAPGDVESFIRNRDFRGINVTMPYKREALRLSDAADGSAAGTGVANTLVIGEDGKLRAFNTDLYGFCFMAERAGISFENKKVLILGGGATAQTVRHAASQDGARSVVTVSRRGENTYDTIGRHSDADVIVNTTPVGMFPRCDGRLVDLDDFPCLSGVLDVVYNPISTRLVLDARRRGIPCSGGLPMLIAQAARACALFGFGVRQPEPVLRKLTLSLKNIVLTGMPGCGKSAVGALLAEKTGRTLIDTDRLIEQHESAHPAEIIMSRSEAHFRKIEEAVIAECGKQHSLVIATGGGSVLSEQNRLNLKQNGFVVHIERDLARLPLTGRPLSQDHASLAELYAERLPLYRTMADCIVINNGTPQQTCDSIMEAFYETGCH